VTPFGLPRPALDGGLTGAAPVEASTRACTARKAHRLVSVAQTDVTLSSRGGAVNRGRCLRAWAQSIPGSDARGRRLPAVANGQAGNSWVETQVYDWPTLWPATTGADFRDRARAVSSEKV